MQLSPLPESFYRAPVLDVARALLGARLVRILGNQRVAGYIIETEAYAGESDLACHARAGRTARTEVMYGPPGRAYVYFIYGIHWMLNCVTEPPGSPSAVLLRALLPSEGVEVIAAHRAPRRPAEWTNGPARICQALEIDQTCNGVDLTDPASKLVIESGADVADAAVQRGPRVGIERVPEPWRSQPWRLWVDLKRWQAPSDSWVGAKE